MRHTSTLLLIAALTAGNALAQQDPKPDNPAKPTPDTQSKSSETDAQAKPGKPEKKKKEKPPKHQACSDIPPDQQILLRLPPEKEAEWARKRAEFQRKTGIYIPPPKPPKPLPPYPPPAAKPDDATRERK